MNYKTAIKNAKHHKALGNSEIYLDGPDFPWHLATKCEPGGSHRLDISTSVWFYGKDPKSGLVFRWSFDIEPYSANGKGSYEIDSAACERVIDQLPPKAAEGFRKYLADCAVKVMKKAKEWQALADRQKNDAAALALLATK